jgi:hypothetical protein
MSTFIKKNYRKIKMFFNFILHSRYIQFLNFFQKISSNILIFLNVIINLIDLKNQKNFSMEKQKKFCFFKKFFFFFFLIKK